MDADLDEEAGGRIRWGNVATAVALLALVTLIVAWPRLSAGAPAVPEGVVVPVVRPPVAPQPPPEVAPAPAPRPAPRRRQRPRRRTRAVPVRPRASVRRPVAPRTPAPRPVQRPRPVPRPDPAREFPMP